MNRKTVLRVGIVLGVLIALAGLVLVHRSYKINKVESLSLRWAEWVKSDVVGKNPVQVVDAFGRREPAWLGVTNNHVVLATPSGPRSPSVYT